MAFEPQGRHADDESGAAGDDTSNQKPDPRRKALRGGQPCAGIGADADEGRLTERCNAANAGQNHQAKHGYGIDAYVVH